MLMISQNNKSTLTNFASNFISQISEETKIPKNYIILDSEKLVKNYAFNFTNGGYVILIDNPPIYTVLAFSEKGVFNVENNPFLAGHSNNAKKVTLDPTNFTSLENTTLNVFRNPYTTVEPFMTDVWGGVNCKDDNNDNVYATNHYTPNHCSPGCVAIAPSQILHYYEWPIKGEGSNVYADNYNGSLLRHKAFFDQNNYDWANMLDEYMGVSSSTVEQQAVGKLMYDMGVSIQMDYESSGSTNNLDNVPFVLENFFRFTGHYEDGSWTSFWDRLYEHMQQQRPVPIAVEASATGDGHVMVANGYKLINSNPYYYINWGWWNNNSINGWYNLQGWNSSTGGYNTITGAIFDMLPEPQITSISANGTANDFVVSWEVSSLLNWDEFTLEQKVDTGTWETVATGIVEKEYTISNPSGTVYQFRVKAKVDGLYYSDSTSEIEIYTITGGYNGYARFEGSQYAYARQTPDNDLDFTNDYTFETWIKINETNQNADVILDQQSVFALEIYDVTASDYSVIFKSHSNTNAELLSSQTGSKLQNGSWYHIAMSKSGSTSKLFVNGTLRDSNFGSDFNLTSSNNALNIGEKYNSGYSSWIKADFDQIRISSIGRYSTDFTPSQDNHFDIDSETIAYFTFQNVHRKRFKDEAYNLSVIVKNESNYISWQFEETTNSLSIENQELLNRILQVYPNPTTDYITIQYTKNDVFDINDFSFYLYDINGKIISIQTINDQSKKIDLQKLITGTYFLTVKGEGFTATKKIIKQ